MCLQKPHIDKLNSHHSTKYATDIIKSKLSGRKEKGTQVQHNLSWLLMHGSCGAGPFTWGNFIHIKIHLITRQDSDKHVKIHRLDRTTFFLVK